MDPMKCVMMVKAQESQYAGEQLVNMSEQQESNLEASKKLRGVQEALDKYAQDGVIDKGEADQMRTLMASVGLTRGNPLTNAGNVVRDNEWKDDEYVYLNADEGAGVDDVEAAAAQTWFDGDAAKVENALKDQEDEQSKIGIDMQIAVQDYTDANGEESSILKQLSDLRTKISSKLDG